MVKWYHILGAIGAGYLGLKLLTENEILEGVQSFGDKVFDVPTDISKEAGIISSNMISGLKNNELFKPLELKNLAVGSIKINTPVKIPDLPKIKVPAIPKVSVKKKISLPKLKL